MKAYERIKTDYPGVTYIVQNSPINGKPERVYYIQYRKNGKLIEEKAGRQFKDRITPAKASLQRSDKIRGIIPTNKEKRVAGLAKKNEAENRWTIEKLWGDYNRFNQNRKSYKTDKSNYELHIKPTFEKREPKTILPLDVARLRIRLLKNKSPQTVKHVLELIRRLINHGTKNRLCKGIDFTIEMPSVDNEKTEDLTTDQLKALLEAIDKNKHPHAGVMMKLALYTGMRRGEMFKLKWGDINYEKEFIHIRDPKGGVDQKIPLNQAANQLLKSHVRIKKSPFVFPGRAGKQRRNIAKPVNEIKKAAKLPKSFRPLHGLRHVYASMLASSGQVDMYTLQKLLTHKDPTMTQRYAHLRDETLMKASNLAGDIIDQAAQKKDKDKEIANS